ncbi:hypothetical protein RD792_016196 [Penstemon davidsonii]|uniref:TIP41-like protein n=1 Tax=Penstemon davidsonii TaxID=160366 RepID=A0ABR0CJU4_9LAMI|nr:hypothetical protein RD792_016196 [Penstemon davidsonii]
MEWESDVRELKAVGAEALGGGRVGLRIRGWEIESSKRSILTSSLVQQWEEKLQTSHLPEMVFGESSLVLNHLSSGIKIYFNAFDALCGWKQEGLPPVEVPAAAKWKFRRVHYDERFSVFIRGKSSAEGILINATSSISLAIPPRDLFSISCSKATDEVILDYDYTFTTPYCGSAGIETNPESGRGASEEGSCSFHWEDCQEQINMVALASKEPILFYDEVILYEDELGDNGVSLLTAKVRVMPSGWYLLLRFWLRVDGVLMRLRDTRFHCTFRESTEPIILREICWREDTFQALSSKGYPSDSAAYSDPDVIRERLPIIKRNTQKLSFT